jgi:hypothetical protein
MLARATSAVSVSLLAALALGCEPPAPTPLDAGADAGADTGGTVDVGVDAGPPPPDVCDELSLPRTPFRTTGVGTGMGEVAGDFTVHTLGGGTFSLRDDWSGCESYVFFLHRPGFSDDVIHTGPDHLITEGRRNVRYFFISTEPDEGARIGLMEGLASQLEEAFVFEAIDDPAEQQFWRDRIHYVTDEASTIGSVSDYITDYLAYASSAAAVVDLGDRGRAYPPPPTVFGIDRAQTWDPGDSLSPAVGAPADLLGMAAFLSHFYEYRGTLEARLAAETDTTVVSLIDETTTGRVFTQDVTLPSATEMAAFDTMEVDVEITCTNGNPFGCSEWDRIADVQLCVDGHACTERLEIARWITPYWRRGRQHYLIDATPFLGLLRDGGARSFFVELGPDWERATEWEAQVSLRMRTRGASEPLATGAVRAFTGGAFDASYNTRPPFAFTPPAGATRVELVTILSGHGQTPTDSCAEWCDHRHTFSVNGTALPEIRHTMPRIGSEHGCAARAADGVIPGQWGNWAQARAYWCPGLAVQAQRTDITSLVTLGSENEMTLEGHFGTRAPNGGDIALSAYVVWYVDP